LDMSAKTCLFSNPSCKIPPGHLYRLVRSLSLEHMSHW
jgi:hypothetical protein